MFNSREEKEIRKILEEKREEKEIVETYWKLLKESRDLEIMDEISNRTKKDIKLMKKSIRLMRKVIKLNKQ